MKILMTVIYILVIGQVGFFFGLSLPRDCFNENAFPYKLFDWEKNGRIYEKIHIRKWKDKVWELGGMAGGFSKSKVADPHSKEYIQTFIIESHKGLLDHFLRICFGFFDIILYPRYVWTVGVPVALVNVALNSMSSMVLRYNLPKLKIAYARLSKIQQTSSEIESPN